MAVALQNLLQGRLFALALTCLLVVGTVRPSLQAQPSPEALVKAGFILKFPLFVEWPASAWPADGKPVVIKVLGPTPVFDQLVEVAKYTNIYTRKVEVKRIKLPSEIRDCQILFVSPSRDYSVEEVLKEVAESPILIIADTPGYGELGVHINLYREGEHVRFEINESRAKRAKLTIGFRLKEVGRIVAEEAGR